MVKEEGEGSPKIFVTGLAADCSKSVLNTFFSKHGKVLDVIYKFGADGKRVKDVAYVLFESEESVNKLLEEKTVTIDDTEVAIKKSSADGGQKEDEPLLAVPKDALKCYVCKREKFPSVEAYLNHKKGKQHQAVYKIFKAKSSAVFQLLKAEAKLAADRAYDSIWMRKNPQYNKMCDLCQCNLVCKLEKHELSVEHKMVKNYNNQKCCEINFTSRHKYEEHLLTLQHLKKTYEKEQQKKKNDVDDGRPNMKKAIDLYKQCDSDLKDLRETYGELDINTEMPAYDKNNPIGLNYIVKKINYHCICCDQKFFAHLNLVEPHCRSYNHYTNMTDYIVGVDKRLGKRKWEEEEAKPKKEVKKEVKKEGDDKESTLKKPVTVKNSNIKRKVEKEAAADEEEEEDEEMDTLDKSNDDDEDVDQSESKDIDEEQEGGDDEEQDDAEEQEEGDEEQEEGDEDQDEGEEVGEEEAAEDQEEVAEDSDVQEAKEEEEDEQMQSDEEAKVTTTPAKKNIDESPAEDSAEDKEEEEVAEESPKPTRGTPRGRRARGRGRGRGLKR